MNHPYDTRRPAGRRPSRSAGLAVLGVGIVMVVGVSTTKPFSWPAMAVTSAGFSLVLGSRYVWGRLLALGTGTSAGSGHAVTPRQWVVWPVLVTIVTGFELYSFFSQPRALHPTLSSILDLADSNPTGRSLVFACWLVLGWIVVR